MSLRASVRECGQVGSARFLVGHTMGVFVYLSGNLSSLFSGLEKDFSLCGNFLRGNLSDLK